MAYNNLLLTALMAFFVVSAVGRSSVSSPSESPATPKAGAPTRSPAVKPPASSPAPLEAAPSPATGASPSSSLSISSPPSEAPEPAPANSAVLNRLNIAGFLFSSLVGAVLII